MYDLAIVGGGPAGVAAGVYAARKRLRTVFLAEIIGGQSTDSQDIQNWIGIPHISGLDFQKALKSHLQTYAGEILEVKIGERVEALARRGTCFSLQTAKGVYEARAVLIASGGARKKLDMPGAKEFENKGVTYCASCDGPLFAGQEVTVVGGGNAGFETAAQLLAYCKRVTLVHRHATFDKADATTVEAVLAHSNMKVLTNCTPIEIKGQRFVTALVVQHRDGKREEVPCTGVFVEIGMVPSTGFVASLLALDAWGRIPVDGKTQRTATPGIWAAGDCSDGIYHQNNIAAGDAVKALEDIYVYLKANKSASTVPTN